MKEDQKYQISNSFSFDESTYLAEKHHHFLDLANIKYVVSDEELKDKNLKPVFNNGGLIVYENKTVLPRAYALVNGKVFGDKDFINIIRYQSNKVFIKINLPTDGRLILSDAYYPGWRAYIDGRETNIYPANIMFRAILAPAGEHNIEFIYQPLWFWPSVVVALLGLIISLYISLYKI